MIPNSSLLSLVFFVAPFLAFGGSGPTSVCSVQKVFTGPSDTYIYLEKCAGELNFTAKKIQLEHHRMRYAQSGSDEATKTDRIDTSMDVLSLKSTAELAMLFQRRLTVQMKTADGDKIEFLSLESPVDLEQNREWKPVNTRRSPTP